MRLGLIIVGVLACGWPVSAQTSDLSVNISIVAMMSAHGADLSTTMFAIGSGRGREANPFFAPFTKKPIAAGAWKMGLASATSWALLRQRKKHPKVVFWMSVGLAGFYTSVAIHNSRVIK